MKTDIPWNSICPQAVEPTYSNFLVGRKHRFGRINPEPIIEPFWDYMVRTRRDPFFVREDWRSYESKTTSTIKKPLVGNGHEDEAIWSFDRLGKSATAYEDSFLIFIGGSHPDINSIDYLIYNEVIVRNLCGDIWIYGYPKAAFPPVTFHTATLLSGEGWKAGIPSELAFGILIVGGTTYTEAIEPWRTPVFWLDLKTFAISSIETSGNAPGWIFDHCSTLVNGRIWVYGGSIVEFDGTTRPNSEAYYLDLASREWSVKRDDEERSRLT